VFGFYYFFETEVFLFLARHFSVRCSRYRLGLSVPIPGPGPVPCRFHVFRVFKTILKPIPSGLFGSDSEGTPWSPVNVNKAGTGWVMMPGWTGRAHRRHSRPLGQWSPARRAVTRFRIHAGRAVTRSGHAGPADRRDCQGGLTRRP
jgi:hypothetical protein